MREPTLDAQDPAPGHDTLLVREAMERVTDDLTAPVDLVGRAVVAGRRRRLRARATLGATAACAAGLTVAGLGAVAGGGGAGSTVTVGTAVTPQRTFAYVTPASAPASRPTGGARTGEPPDVAAYRQRAAAVLQDLLPPAVGDIRLVAGDVSAYQGTAGGATYAIRFSVLPAPHASVARSCGPSAAKGGTCRIVRLPGGVPAAVRVAPMNDGHVTGTSVSFHLGGSDVTVSVSPDDAEGASAPVTAQDMQEFVENTRVLDLLHEADIHPVQPAGVTVNEGERQ